MTPEDKEALNEFARGVAFTIGVIGVLLVIVVLTGRWEEEPSKQPVSDTKVVGEYKGCDIVQWHYGPLAEYKYFLYCNNDRSNRK